MTATSTAGTPAGATPPEPTPPEPTPEQADATIRSKSFVGLLIIVAVIGVVVSFLAWGFLELLYQITRELYTHLPNALGYHHGPPTWWPLPILAAAGVIVALAITRAPGNGGHIPAMGLAAGKPPIPIELPGVVLAGLVGVSFGIVLGPEAPLLALGPGVAVLMVRLLPRDLPAQAVALVAAAGAFAAISFLFVQPLVAAVLVVEVTALGGARQRLVLIPGLLAAGIGSLLAIGLGSWTGLNRSQIALGPVQVPHFGQPTVAQFGWTILLAIAVGFVAQLIMRGGLLTHRFVAPRTMLLLPIIGLVVAGLAIAFSQAAGKSANEVLFSGESGLPGLVAQAGAWSV
ncbi:MAG: chloride channel protein, partial [Solirubrobacterales bacterium]|nr:chloride channel protein [Solirubrobacterales bacterium]